MTTLTIISNNPGEPGRALGETFRRGKVRRAIGSYFTSNPEAAGAYARGTIEMTLLAAGKEVRECRLPLTSLRPAEGV